MHYLILIIILAWLAINLLMPVIRLFAPDAEAGAVFRMLPMFILGALMVSMIGLIFYGLYRVFGSVAEATSASKIATYLKERNPRWQKQQKRRAGRAWEWVVLPDAAKEELQTLQGILRNPRDYKRHWGQEPPLGMILYGPSGTGKTLITRTLAQASGYGFLAPSPAELKSMWMGEGERNIRALYEAARNAAPCIVFLDEIDAVASQRSAGGHDPGGAGRGENSVTNQLLQEIDGLKQGNRLVFTVGATNRLDILDNALKSRLSYQVYVGLPDEEARERLFISLHLALPQAAQLPPEGPRQGQPGPLGTRHQDAMLDRGHAGAR